MQSLPHPTTTDRFQSLDVLRGFAAMSVVISHWQHFYYSASQRRIDIADKTVQPLYDLLWPFYEYGAFAVDLFFALSGFIFFCYYARKISNRTLSWRSFVLLRFSRLYPLHIATLVIVAALQLCYWGQNGVYFVYQSNDFGNFVLQLLFASNWFPKSPFSFNGPIWSVSIEILLYALFFLTCRLALNRAPFVALLSICGAFLSFKFDFIGRGLFSFFIGGLCFQLSDWINKLGENGRLRAQMSLVGVVTCTFAILGTDIFSHVVAATVQLATDMFDKTVQTEIIKTFLVGWCLKIAVFPSTIIFLAISEQRLRPITSRLSWIGDITYSSYLIHFPMQLCLILLSAGGFLSLSFESPVTLLAYLALLVILSFATFHYFEKPMQDLIRRNADTQNVNRK